MLVKLYACKVRIRPGHHGVAMNPKALAKPPRKKRVRRAVRGFAIETNIPKGYVVKLPPNLVVDLFREELLENWSSLKVQ